MAKQPRKSVTFQHVSGDEKESGGSPAVSRQEIAIITNPPVVIPVHYPLFVYGLFHYGISTDPFKILLQSLPTLILLQLGYGYLIAVHTSHKKSAKENYWLLLASSMLASFVLSGPLFLVVILFGAPLASHLAETFVLSVHLALTVVFPLAVFFKLDIDKFAVLFKLERIYRAVSERQIILSSFLGVVGCWLGVIPIPLDWDRPWQQWPITLVVGAYTGAFVGGVVGAVIATTK